MKGANVFATKRVFDWASRYFFADLFESLFSTLNNGGALTVAEKSASSLLGGVFSTLVTLPLDVLVAKTQDAKKAGVKVSALKLFQDELREKGLSGLRNAYMRGFEARLLHVCLTTLGRRQCVGPLSIAIWTTPSLILAFSQCFLLQLSKLAHLLPTRRCLDRVKTDKCYGLFLKFRLFALCD